MSYQKFVNRRTPRRRWSRRALHHRGGPVSSSIAWPQPSGRPARREGFFRLAVLAADPDSHRPQGIFRCVGLLCDVVELTLPEARRLDEMLDWFNTNLPVPSADRIPARAIFWLKPERVEFRSRLWELAHFIQQQGLLIDVQCVLRPGLVAYEDDYQVAAVPFRERR